MGLKEDWRMLDALACQHREQTEKAFESGFLSSKPSPPPTRWQRFKFGYYEGKRRALLALKALKGDL